MISCAWMIMRKDIEDGFVNISKECKRVFSDE
jgi:hypothetical protein